MEDNRLGLAKTEHPSTAAGIGLQHSERRSGDTRSAPLVRRTRSMKSLRLFFCVATFSSPIAGFAAEPGAGLDISRLWVNAGLYSYHIDRSREPKLRDPNPGLGFEYPLSADWTIAAGRFINSNDRVSRYAGAVYQPLRILRGRAGVMFGAFDGYPNAFGGGWFPALIPAISWEWGRVGLNLAAVPPYRERLHGAVSFQLKVRLGN